MYLCNYLKALLVVFVFQIAEEQELFATHQVCSQCSRYENYACGQPTYCQRTVYYECNCQNVPDPVASTSVPSAAPTPTPIAATKAPPSSIPQTPQPPPAVTKSGRPTAWFKASGWVSSPTVGDGALYVGTTAGEIYAIDPVTGQASWVFKSGASSSATTPKIAAGVVFVGFSDVYTSNSSTLYAFNAKTGQEIWRATFPAGVSNNVVPAVADGVVFIGSDSDINGWGGSTFYAFNAGTGKQIWNSTPIIQRYLSLATSPTVANSIVYVGSNGDASTPHIYAFDVVTGRQIWNSTDGYKSSPVVANGVVYVGSYSTLYALNALTGARIWSSSIPGTFSELFFSATGIFGNTIYIGCASSLELLNMTSGQRIWSFDTGTKTDVACSPVLTGGVVYFVSNGDYDRVNYTGYRDNNIWAIDTVTKQAVWKASTADDWLLSSPAVTNGIAYVGSFRGNIYAVSTSTGNQISPVATTVPPTSAPVTTPTPLTAAPVATPTPLTAAPVATPASSTTLHPTTEPIIVQVPGLNVTSTVSPRNAANTAFSIVAALLSTIVLLFGL